MNESRAPENPIVLLQKEIRKKILKSQLLSCSCAEDYHKVFLLYQQLNQDLMRKLAG